MVIFNCDHYGALSQMIVLRYKFHKNDEAILLVPKDNRNVDIYRGLEDNKIFDKVITYNSHIGCREGNKERAGQVVCDYFEDLFRESAINLTAADKVYFANDTLGSLGIYAYIKCIEYSIVELYPGQWDLLGRHKIAVEGGDADEAYGELLLETSALTGDEKLVEKYVLVLPRSENENFRTHKCMLYVDYTKELSELPNEIKERILGIYDVKRNDLYAIDTLILPNSSSSLRPCVLQKEKYPYLYQLLLDYYVKNAGTILIKTHLYSSIDYVGKIPDAVKNWDSNFPIEFIALFSDVRIKNVVALKSTAVDKIKLYADNSIQTGRGYFSRQLFQKLHRLYVAYSLVEAVDKQSVYYHQTHNFRFLQKYLHYVFPQIDSKELNSIEPDQLNGTPFTVVACCPPAKRNDNRNDDQKGGEDSVTIFFNGDNGFDFYDVQGPELLKQVIPIKITKTALHDDILADMSDEYVYVFAKDIEVREKVRAFSMSRTLYYTGIEIKAAPAEDSEIDLTKNKICLEDIESTRKEVVNCLTEW